MMRLKDFFLFLLFFYMNDFSSLADYCTPEQSYVLRSVVNLGVLEANGTNVSLQYYTGNPSQLWKFECSNKPGTFYIVNVDSSMVLDVDSSTASDTHGSVIAHSKGTSLYQEWYLHSDRTIVNADLRKHLYSYWSEVGGPLIVAETFSSGYDTFLVTTQAKIY